MFLIALPAARLTASVEAQHVGAHGPDWNFSILERLLIAGRAVWFYTCSIVAPANLTFIYPRWHIDPSQWWQYLYPIGVIGVVVTLWMKRHRWGKGPLVGCLYFIGTLAPALGFVNVYPMLFSFVADHFQYLASIGALALTAAAAAKISVSWPHAARVALTAGMMIVLIAISWAQESKYKDAESLWTDTIRKNPGAWIAHNNLSEPLLARGDFDGAAEHALMALELRPNYPPAHNNLGLAFQGLKRNEDAVQEFRRAIELDPTMPQARLNLAEQLINQNDLDAAEHEYTEAIRLAPDFADAHYNYAVLLAMRRRRDEALREAHIACKLNPDDAQSALLLGKLEGTNP
jgi:tetratricopeptide (TPR) repeat protein